MLTSVHQPAYSPACRSAQQRVAIAGTVTNGATQEGLPQVLVRITHAPVACIERFFEILEQALTHQPHLMASYQHLMRHQPMTTDTLKLAHLLFNTFERNQWLGAPRPDQLLTGGDGHYCFFDLPPGDYGLTATLSVPQVCQGSTHGRVQVHASNQWLSFSALDLTLSLQSPSSPLPSPRLGASDGWPWLSPDDLQPPLADLASQRAVP